MAAAASDATLGSMNRMFKLPFEVVCIILSHLCFHNIYILFETIGHPDFSMYLAHTGRELLGVLEEHIHPDAEQFYNPIPVDYPLDTLHAVQSALWNIILVVDITEIDSLFQTTCSFLTMEHEFPHQHFGLLKKELVYLTTTFLDIDFVHPDSDLTGYISRADEKRGLEFNGNKRHVRQILKDNNIFTPAILKYCVVILISQYHFNRDAILDTHPEICLDAHGQFNLTNYYEQLKCLLLAISEDYYSRDHDNIIIPSSVLDNFFEYR